MLGLIFLWFGAIVDIPAGWQICDGTNDTPDLRNKIVIGAGSSYAPDDTGGGLTHDHGFTGDGHIHSRAAPINENFGPLRRVTVGQSSITGTTDTASSLPPYHALAYIGWVGQ